MNPELNEKIAAAQQGIARMQKIDKMLNQLASDKEERSKREAELKDILDKESKDLDKLNDKSITSLIYSMLGKLDEKTDKEQQEVIAAKLKYDQAVKDVQEIEGKISALITERAQYANCQNDFEKLYDIKKEELIRESGESANRLIQLTQEINNTKNNITEIEEAKSAGNKAFDNINRVLKSLNSAEGWRLCDIADGDLISDLAKHSSLDKANEDIKNIQTLLRNFRTELIDIKISTEVHTDISEFTRFTDIFLDGLFSNFFVQDRIHRAQDRIVQIKYKVYLILEKLENMLVQEKSHIESLENEIKKTVLKA